MDKALEITRDIVVATAANCSIAMDAEQGKNVAAYIEDIFNKVRELEKK